MDCERGLSNRKFLQFTIHEFVGAGPPPWFEEEIPYKYPAAKGASGNNLLAQNPALHLLTLGIVGK
jgi:hypothetical protein